MAWAALLALADSMPHRGPPVSPARCTLPGLHIATCTLNTLPQAPKLTLAEVEEGDSEDELNLPRVRCLVSRSKCHVPWSSGQWCVLPYEP